MVALTVLVERRPFALADQYPSLWLGDVLLAGAVGIGYATGRDAGWPRPILIVVPILAGLAFGVWQLGYEVETGIYTSAQAASPSKLWHQFAVYPTLATLVVGAVVLARGRRRAVAAVAALILAWASLNVWDSWHPREPHCEFSWSNWSDGCYPYGVTAEGD